VAVRIGHMEIAFSPGGISRDFRIKSPVPQMISSSNGGTTGRIDRTRHVRIALSVDRRPGALVNVEPGWEDLLTNYNIHRVLLPTVSVPANILAETAEWKMIYEDQVGVIFVRSSASF
jgi:hypothetical protein